ncbi:MAG: fumarate reductase/succinate dehydrogenase flavoprotein subunit, partial [Planctomycetaceae bacterium]|nr:fumarate reductase/succinate dehydrogenase flavoprotein subunit [Planctomycetaceae bacterium]
NRLGASALMQGLADGYFVIPATLGNYLATAPRKTVSTEDAAFTDRLTDAQNRISKILSVNGTRTVDSIHRELGLIMWNNCGMSRNEAGLQHAIGQIRDLREEFWSNVKVLGSGEALNQNLEHAGRLADFLEFGELLARDALHREESCGGHFREEHQTPENEALRNDEDFCYTAAWEFNGVGEEATLHREQLEFEAVPLATRSYK